MENKICSKCNIEKQYSEFYNSNNTKDKKRPECKDCFKRKAIDNYQNNRNVRLDIAKKYRDNNQEKVKECKKKYRKNNPDKVKKRIKLWHEKNPNKELEYGKKRRELYPHIEAWRSILKNSLKRLDKTKEGNTIELLGYSALDLKEHIESLFTDGMTWDNYGEWHIDHIKPVSSFDKDTPQSIVNALSNLQPLWATTREINGVVYEGNLNKGRY